MHYLVWENYHEFRNCDSQSYWGRKELKMIACQRIRGLHSGILQ